MTEPGQFVHGTGKYPRTIRSEEFPGTAQQFRAQMQRFYNKNVILLWPPLVENQLLVMQSGGRWESADGARLVFREERQLEPTGHFGPIDGDVVQTEPAKRADITPDTRTTWAVQRLREKALYSERPEPPARVEDVRDHGDGQVEYVVTLKDYGYAGIEAYEHGSTTTVEFLDGYDPVGQMDYGLPPEGAPIGPPFEDFCEMVYRKVWPAQSVPVAEESRCGTAGLEQRRQAAEQETTQAVDRRASGRPRNKDDDWACREVREKGRDRREVYPEWLEMIGGRRAELWDAREKFKKATSAKRWQDIQKARKGTKGH